MIGTMDYKTYLATLQAQWLVAFTARQQKRKSPVRLAYSAPENDNG